MSIISSVTQVEVEIETLRERTRLALQESSLESDHVREEIEVFASDVRELEIELEKIAHTLHHKISKEEMEALWELINQGRSSWKDKMPAAARRYSLGIIKELKSNFVITNRRNHHPVNLDLRSTYHGSRRNELDDSLQNGSKTMHHRSGFHVKNCEENDSIQSEKKKMNTNNHQKPSRRPSFAKIFIGSTNEEHDIVNMSTQQRLNLGANQMNPRSNKAGASANAIATDETNKHEKKRRFTVGPIWVKNNCKSVKRILETKKMNDAQTTATRQRRMRRQTINGKHSQPFDNGYYNKNGLSKEESQCNNDTSLDLHEKITRRKSLRELWMGYESDSKSYDKLSSTKALILEKEQHENESNVSIDSNQEEIPKKRRSFGPFWREGNCNQNQVEDDKDESLQSQQKEHSVAVGATMRSRMKNLRLGVFESATQIINIGAASVANSIPYRRSSLRSDDGSNTTQPSSNDNQETDQKRLDELQADLSMKDNFISHLEKEICKKQDKIRELQEAIYEAKDSYISGINLLNNRYSETSKSHFVDCL